jgi:hypothetical protein
MKDHSLMHKTIALSDPTSETPNDITAYLKISITIAATGDEQVQITDDHGPDSEEVMMPLSIRPEFYQIILRIFTAQKLPSMDTAIFGGKGSIDAYVNCTYMTKTQKTAILTTDTGTDVVFNEEF